MIPSRSPYVIRRHSPLCRRMHAFSRARFFPARHLPYFFLSSQSSASRSHAVRSNPTTDLPENLPFRGAGVVAKQLQ